MSKDYDPRMHTAEHVVNQTMIRTFGCARSYSMHLEKNKTRVDYHFSRALEPDEIATLEATVNATLDACLPVTETSRTVAEAATLLDISKLPPALAAAPDTRIRIVSVGDYDMCPCIGAHVANTSEVGHVQIVSHDFTPPTSTDLEQTGRLRVRFKLV